MDKDYFGYYHTWQWATPKSIDILIREIERKIAKEEYSTGLAEIKQVVRRIMREYKGRWDIREKRRYLNVLASLTQEIYDKMNTVDKDKKKFPVKHQPVRRAQVRKVIRSG